VTAVDRFSSHSQRAPKAWTLQNYTPFDDGAPEHVRRRRSLRDLADMYLVQSMKSRSCSVNEVKVGRATLPPFLTAECLALLYIQKFLEAVQIL
jgi:hypothetical protein